MKSNELYSYLDTKFEVGSMDERDWLLVMEHFTPFLSDNFIEKQQGLLFDFTSSIKKIYTATFVSSDVVSYIKEQDESNCLLITHHPLDWVVYGNGNERDVAFEEIDKPEIQLLQEKQISIYNLHTPLDKVGPVSTGMSLLEAVGGSVIHGMEFLVFGGIKVGVVGKTDIDSVTKLHNHIEALVGHKCSLYSYGQDEIKDNLIGSVGGGGFKERGLQDLVKMGVNTYITGITMNTPYNEKAHKYAEKHGINIIGATHYSTEKFAMMKIGDMIEREFGIKHEFIPENPELQDIDI